MRVLYPSRLRVSSVPFARVCRAADSLGLDYLDYREASRVPDFYDFCAPGDEVVIYI